MLCLGPVNVLVSVDGADSKGQALSLPSSPHGSLESTSGPPYMNFLLLLRTDSSLTFPAQERLSTFNCYLHSSLRRYPKLALMAGMPYVCHLQRLLYHWSIRKS